MRKALSLPVLLVGLGLVILWKLAVWDARVAAKDDLAIQGAKQALAAAKPYRAQISRLQAAAQQAQNRAQNALRAANSLSATVRRLEILPPDTTPVRRATVDSLILAAEQRDSLRLVAIAALQIQVTAESRRAEIAEQRVGQLEASLKSTLAVAQCHLLGAAFLPRCPSRNASLLLGMGIGATAVILAK